MNILARGIDPLDAVEVEVLVDAGALCVAQAVKWMERERWPGLFRVYHKKSGLPLGPYYAALLLADEAMRKALKIPGVKIWENDVPFFTQNRWIKTWVEANLGKNGDLVGGTWVDET